MRKLLAAALLLAPLPALAQVQPRQPKSVINFDKGDEVGGTRSAPSVEVVDSADHDPRHSSIIRVRTSFAEKVLASSKELH